MARLLVTGGAGYVGSHTARHLRDVGHDVVVFDRLYEGYREAAGASLIVGDLRDRADVERLFLTHGPFDGVLHFAARMSVAESVADPLGYWDVNVGGTLTLLSSMARHGVRKLVFSSTAAVYGVPAHTPIAEDAPFAPINPYGASKAAVERLLVDLGADPAWQIARLRYFNAAGGAADGWIGEAHDPETHLLPLALDAVLGGVPLTLFGEDYPTPDGTCIRDYVHVDDLADAHRRAWDRIAAHGGSGVWNLGSGKGYSLREVLGAIETVTGLPVPHRFGPRRAGDPPSLLADASRAAQDLGWKPQRDLRAILADAWRWRRQPRYGRNAWRVPNAGQ
jgi:UDP-glucose 4-epimerase